MTLAGALSEEIWFGQRSTGARNDFHQAWELAREIVNSGLSELGIISPDDVPRDIIFSECTKIIKKLEEETMELLTEHKSLVQSVSMKLLEEETLDREKFTGILQAS